MHKIKLVGEFKLVVQSKRRLNPTMNEVVKKGSAETFRWRNDISYSNSLWVRPVQVVPKNGGMSVIINEKNVVIPTHAISSYNMCLDYQLLEYITFHYDLCIKCSKD